jgi:hypothetical protein
MRQLILIFACSKLQPKAHVCIVRVLCETKPQLYSQDRRCSPVSPCGQRSSAKALKQRDMDSEVMATSFLQFWYVSVGVVSIFADELAVQLARGR